MMKGGISKVKIKILVYRLEPAVIMRLPPNKNLLNSILRRASN